MFLLRKKENRTANRLLGILMIIFAIDLLNGASFLTGFIKHFPWSTGLSNSFPYLYGPMVYLYVRILTKGKNKFDANYFLHFIPFILIQVYGFLFFYFEGTEYQLSLLDFSTIPPWHIQLIGILIPVHGVTYMIFTVIESYHYNRKIKQSYSSIEKINLAWIRHFVVGTVIIWLVVVLAYALNFMYGDDLQANILIYISLTILLYSLGLKSLSQPQVEFQTEDKERESKMPQYKKSGLDNAAANEIHTSLLKVMEDNKPFLNSKLNLSELANVLGISTHNLSEVINKKENQNFYDFVNRYRVDEVKRLIQQDKEKRFSILALGFDAGFSSKSAFYSAFKRSTGMTPALFREKIS